MKRIQLACLTLTLLLPTVTIDAAPRTVICENFTATWCVYCPDVANGLIMLMDEFPDTCISMQVHGQDDYATSWGNNRHVFYSIPGYPTVWMDGVFSQVGSYGSPAANYSQLRSRYLQRIATPTDVTISTCGWIVDGNTYGLTANVAIEDGGSGKSMIIHCAQVLRNYPSTPSYNYGCFKQAAVQTITLSEGGSQSVNFEFDLDSSSTSHLPDVFFIVWAQSTNSSGPSEVYQADKHVYNSGDCQIDNYIVGPKGDFATISEALAKAGTGDTIQVMPGTYFETLDFGGSNVVVESLGGAEVTIIDGSGNDSVVRMYAQENATLRGFTLQNGSSLLGGGIICNGSPVIEDCIIRNNEAQYGAGIYHLENGSAGPIVSGTWFCSNTGSDIHGDWIDGGGNVFDDECEVNACPADINGDAFVNVSDILLVIDAWGTSGGAADINADGIVDVGDLLEVVGNWGACE
jgi:hypothetical protein